MQHYIQRLLGEVDQYLLDMKKKTSLMLFSFAGVLGLALWFSHVIPGIPAQPNPEKDAAMMQALLQGLDQRHFQPKAIDDKFSANVYKTYLEDVDNAKRLLTQADIDQLKAFEKSLDDQALAGTFEFFDKSVVMLQSGLNKSQNWYREILARPLDFSQNDELQADGKKNSWAKDDSELRQRWAQWMKYEVLSRINEELDKQEKPDFKGEKKTFAQHEEAQRVKVLDIYDKYYKRLAKLDRSRRLEQYLNAFTTVMDPHSGYFSPREKENFDINMSGKLEGIGARLQSDGEKTTVSEIVPGGPAWKEGSLQAKDVISKIAQGESTDEAIDVMGWDLDDVVSKVRGPKNTRVTLYIQKPDGSEKVITLTRDLVIMEEGLAKSLLLENDGVTEKIGYIYLPKFYADFTPQGVTSCAADVAKEIEKLKREQVSGVILDLRNNGGGSLRDVVQMSGLFIEQGPIVQVKSRSRNPEIMQDYDSRVQWGGPLVVMVNGYSASASEILAAAMQDYKRAVIIGSAGTYGKGTVQRFLDLDNLAQTDDVKPLGEMKLTIQKFYRVTGKTTQLDGVKPDIVLPDFYNYVDLGERENDFPLESTTIDAVPFEQKAYYIRSMDQLKAASAARVKADPVFKKVEDNALRYKKIKDNTRYPLQAEKYRDWNRKLDKEAEQYEDMFKPIDAFKIQNLAADLPAIKSDTSRMARNDDWIKDRKKDIQLFEAVKVIQDMIRMDGVAVKRD